VLNNITNLKVSLKYHLTYKKIKKIISIIFRVKDQSSKKEQI